MGWIQDYTTAWPTATGRLHSVETYTYMDTQHRQCLVKKSVKHVGLRRMETREGNGRKTRCSPISNGASCLKVAVHEKPDL